MKAMLQSIVTTCPSMQNGSSSSPSPSSPPPSQPPSSSSTCPSASTCDICRICHCEAENDAPLIGPCVCAGSLRYVHQACLQQWIKSSNTKKCELCKFEFIMHTKIKPLRQWERLQMTSMERRRIFCSVTFHVVAITCVVWSLYVLIDRTAEEVKAGVLEWPFWTKLIVVAIGFSGGLVFMYVQCKMYLHLCQRWKAFNRIIYVQNAPPKSASTAVTAVLSNQASSTESTSKVDSTADTCVVTMVTETTTTTTTTVLQSAPNSPPPPPPVEVQEQLTAEDGDHEGESATVISGSEVTMVEPIDRVT